MISDAQALLSATIASFGAVRIYELILDRRHEARLQARGGHRVGQDGLPWIVAGQVILFAGLVVEGLLRPPAPRITALAWTFLPMATLALALRHWCIQTLGDRWTIRVVTVPDEPLIRRGPYRFLRHPNYAAVGLEMLSLPIAFELWWTAAAVAAVSFPALAYRIHRENQALGRHGADAAPAPTS